MTEEQQKIVDHINSKKKSKFYFNEFLDLFPDKGPRDVKKILTVMVQTEILEFWSSGSTTLYALKGAGQRGTADAGRED